MAKQIITGTKEVKVSKQKEAEVKSPIPKKTAAKKAFAQKDPAIDSVITQKPAAKKTPAKEKTATKPVTLKKSATKKSTTKKRQGLQRLIFQLKFHTEFGQNIFITGDHPLLGDGVEADAVPLQYFNEEYWYLSLYTNEPIDRKINYHYILRNADGIMDHDEGNDKFIDPAQVKASELLLLDAWNHTGFIENVFYTEAFSKVLLSGDFPVVKKQTVKNGTHTLRVKAPLLEAGQTLCILGSGTVLQEWNTATPLLMQHSPGNNWYETTLDLRNASFPIAYKYGVYDTVQKQFIRYEHGDNRILFDVVKTDRETILHDGFAALPVTTWKGTGVSIPVFSLRSEKSFGTGEFSDIMLLANWCKQAGIKMIQVLPVNDTTATNTWRDSYPYSAVSAFALHPLYMNLEKIATTKSLVKKLQSIEKEKVRLNALPALDYEAVTKIKNDFIKTAYAETATTVFKTTAYKTYFEKSRHWLIPYAAFCYLRDTYQTVDHKQWPAYNVFDAEAINKLSDENAESVGLYYFTQFQLHNQLTEATQYARERGVIVKGDLPIGVSRTGADAWQDPSLYNMHFQAGAPPDDFAVKGQNWGFPTYNWRRMREDGFAWWKQRFAQMEDYFDAFRIDHILGFFRIWSIPLDAVEGIMGFFVPAIPVHISEFNSKGIWFDHERYTKPFITGSILHELFGQDTELVKSLFLSYDGDDQYTLKPAYATQRRIEDHFATLPADEQHAAIKQGLFDLVSNVLLFAAEDSNGLCYHFRFNMEHTFSFRNLDTTTQQQLKELYINYFFRRQDVLWREEALRKLPELKRVTNMLVCGEDLGLIPACVPDVMKHCGLLSLEIQRMPKDASKQFFHPADAPYLSVVTPSTHDMSTIRGWWAEDINRTQYFFGHELGQPGEAPQPCDTGISKAIILQHLYSPAMWSVFQLQDLLGMDEILRNKEVDAERINVPADPKHYWQYRMHINLETLLADNSFTDGLRSFIQSSGR